MPKLPPAPEPTAFVVISVYPIGQPGKVGLVVDTGGPASLNTTEVVQTLRLAVDGIVSGDIKPLRLPQH
jgi:hypothetical protein